MPDSPTGARLSLVISLFSHGYPMRFSEVLSDLARRLDLVGIIHLQRCSIVDTPRCNWHPFSELKLRADRSL